MTVPASTRVMSTQDLAVEISSGFVDFGVTKTFGELSREISHWTRESRCVAIAAELFVQIIETRPEAQRTKEWSVYNQKMTMFETSCATLTKRYGACKVAGLMARACEAFLATFERYGIMPSDALLCLCFRELSLAMPARGGAQFLQWIERYYNHPSLFVRRWAVRVLDSASTAADGVLAQPLLDLMSSDPDLEVRRLAASCLQAIWRGKAPSAAIPSILPLLRARRERDPAFFP